jgi:hypothetical protein
VSASPAPAALFLTRSRSRLLEKLVASVRAEFRTDIYLIDPHDPVLGRGPCSVAGCDRSATQNKLCSGHERRWIGRGRPELIALLTDAGPELNGRRDLTVCGVEGCRYGCSGLGLCMRHRPVFERSG